MPTAQQNAVRSAKGRTTRARPGNANRLAFNPFRNGLLRAFLIALAVEAQKRNGSYRRRRNMTFIPTQTGFMRLEDSEKLLRVIFPNYPSLEPCHPAPRLEPQSGADRSN
jgi:hypothetical protein